MQGAVYTAAGHVFTPTDRATSPWSPRTQHGGPAMGLLARAVLRAAPGDALRLSRFTADLFRRIPMEPVTTRVSVLRHGRRLAVLRAELVASETVVATAHASFLTAGALPASDYAASLEGPEGLDTGRLLPEPMYDAIGRGFDAFVEVRWQRRDEPGAAAWFRMPGPLVESEETLPFERAIVLSDYVNALCSLGGPSHRAAFINTDASIHFAREPEGEWIGLQATGLGDSGGAGFGEALVFDARGCVGRAVQSRLANEGDWRG